MNTKHNQKGFSVFSALLIVIVIAAIYFGWKFVVSAGKDNEKQANTLETALVGEKPSSDEPEEVEIPDSPSTAKEVDIQDVELQMQAIYVVMIAKLPGVYTGTCVVEVEHTNGTGYRRFVQDFEETAKCQITIPSQRLGQTGRWTYKTSYYTKDGKIRGNFRQGEFTLQ